MNSIDIKHLVREILNQYEKLQHENQNLRLQVLTLEKTIYNLTYETKQTGEAISSSSKE